MAAKAILAVAVLLLMAVPAVPLRAQAPAALPLKFDIGYGPAMLFPSSTGTPVFSAGDELWARSGYNISLTVQVTPVGPNATSYAKGLPPGVPVELLKFNATSPQGFWVLGVANSSAFYPSVVLLVSDAAATPSGLALAGKKFTGASLAMNFTTSSSLALYAGQACVFGSQDPSGAVVPIPASPGGGSLVVTRSGDTLALFGQGLGGGNFSVSAELYYSYSFLAPNSTAILLTRSVEVAAAPGVLMAFNAGSVAPRGGALPSLTLRDDAPLKPGRYQLRVFFEGSGGVSLSSTQVLIPGGDSWVWLGGCEEFPVYSNDFGVTVPLGSATGGWPRYVWVTYTSYGAQGCAEVPLNLQLATVNFVGAPWGAKLSNYRIDLSSAVGVSQYEVFNGTVYLALGQPAGSFRYAAGLDGRDYFNGTVSQVQPFTSTTVQLNVSRVMVTYVVGGTPYAGGTVTLSDSKGVVSSAGTGTAGEAVFYAPPGDYTVSASGENSSASQSFTLLAGQTVDITLGGSGAGSLDLAFEAALVAAVIAGVAANLLLFARGRGRARSA